MKKSMKVKKIVKKEPITVGNDEFCPHCMDWCEYDEMGKCKKCRKLIKKMMSSGQKITDEFDFTDFSSEHGED
jgi:hypothetical protein